MNAKLCCWNDRKQKPSLLLITDENRPTISLPPAEDDVKVLAKFINECVRSDTADLLLKRIIATIQYNHPGYTHGDINDDLSRALSVIQDIAEGR